MPQAFGLVLSQSQNLAWNLAELCAIDGGGGGTPSPPANVITTDSGDPITTDSGDYITTD